MTHLRSWLGVGLLGVTAACGGGSSSNGDLSIALDTECTVACEPGVLHAAAITIDNRLEDGLLLDLKLTPHGEIVTSFDDNDEEPSNSPSLLMIEAEAQEFMIQASFVCTGAGGSLEASFDGADDHGTSAVIDILCPDEGGGVADANVVAIAQVTSSEAGAEPLQTFGGLQVFAADSAQADKDLARDGVIDPFFTTPVGTCAELTNPGSPDITRLPIPASTEFPQVGGGPGLVWAENTGFVVGAPDLGATYDAEIAPFTGFAGLDAPGLVWVPELPTNLVAGTVITSGDPSGFLPGHDLGVFAADATSLPSCTWIPPSGTTNVVMRIFDPHNNDATGATLTVCNLGPAATGFTMPQAVFDAAGLNSSGQSFDTITMDLMFANLAVAPITGTTTDEQALSAMIVTEKNLFFRKQ
jgi:hypothetical protein